MWRSRTARSPRSAPSLDDGDQILDAAGCIVTPGLRRPARAPPRAGPRGGRDDRDRQLAPPRSAGSPRSSRCRTPTRRTTRWRSIEFVRAPGPSAPACARSHPAGCITVDRDGHRAGAVRRAGRRRRAAVHRRRQRRAGPAADASRAGVRARARHHAGAALRGREPDEGRGDARGLVLQPPRPARLAGASPRS